MEPISVSFATTHEDFRNSRFAQARMQVPRSYDFAARLLGVYLLLAAGLLLAACAVWNMPFRFLGAAAAAGGVFLLFLYRPLFNSVVGRRAEADFASGRGAAPSQTVWFRQDGVEFLSERYEARIPYEMLCRAYENESVFLLFTGLEEYRCIPKRAMSAQDCRQVTNLLADRMKQKFKQEGAREWTK